MESIIFIKSVLKTFSNKLKLVVMFFLLVVSKGSVGQTICNFGIYAAPGSGSGYVSNVVITGGGVSNATGSDGGLVDYTGSPGAVQRSSGYATSISYTSTGSTTYTWVGVDWNDDGDFSDADEVVFPVTVNTLSTAGTHSFTLNVPAAASLASVRMRVFNSVHGVDGCTYSSGEAEDYELVVSAAGAAPTVDNVAVGGATCSSLAATGNISSNGGLDITEMGFVYQLASEPGDPEIGSDTKVTETLDVLGGAMAETLSDLLASTPYEVRAFATNSSGTTYSANTVTISTAVPCVPTVTTQAASGLYCTSGTLNGSLTYAGGGDVTKGFIYGISEADVNSSTSTALVGTSSLFTHADVNQTLAAYTGAVTGLTASTTYWVKAFGKNAGGEYSPAATSFMTKACDAPTLVGTTAASSIDCDSGESGGNVTDEGGGVVTARGLAYRTATLPTTSHSTVPAGGTTGAWTAEIPGLSVSTTYYVRSYATNDYGTAYGAEISFTTNPTCGPVPTMTSLAATGVHCESMTANSQPTVLNGTPTEKGFIFGDDIVVVTAATVTSLGGASKVLNEHVGTTPLNAYALEMYPLTPSTTYYYKAYMANENGPGYGAVITQATTAACPVFYSCAAADTWDTDPACPLATSSPGGTAIVYARHDWRNPTYSPLTDHSLTNLANGNFSTKLPYRWVVESGGHLYQSAANHVAGTQIIVNSGGTYGSNGAMDISPGANLKITRLQNNGTMYLNGSFTNRSPISGDGRFCISGAFINDLPAGGNFNDVSDADMSPYLDDDFNPSNTNQCLNMAVLAVELLSFEASYITDLVELKWVTGSETRNDYFEVLVSSDGKTWEAVAVVDGAGNSEHVNNYVAKDFDTDGFNVKYYKVKAVDFDGKASFSSVNAVFIGGDNGGIVYSHYNGNKLNVLFKGIVGEVKLKVYDIQSNDVKLEEILVYGGTPRKLMATVPNLSSGFYFLQLSDGKKDYSYKLLVR